MIRVSDLTHAFGERVVLRDLDLDIEKGEIVAIMGTSGGGKTTLLKCITGLLTPTQGTVEVAGIDVRKDPEAARRKMGMVFQSAALFDYLDVAGNVLFGVRRWLHLDRDAEQKLMRETLATVGLEGVETLMPSELSGGMRKRVGVARALALNPDVMLYDEPTTGLDPITTYTIDALIVQVRKTFGATSVVVSHDVSSVFRVADKIAFLEGGELSFTGSPQAFAASERPAIREMVEKARAETFG
ncbi:MAG: ATP-binding cassette domain-containing protein [Fimbriimonadaceae bacterium]|nr:ATP-binding cassette domain-containing protein [Chthonomonadaceae bacterium]MCO5297137.1 ATP-binding cassette domain-containing protein [Fimbriimonadaceae bacterium]